MSARTPFFIPGNPAARPLTRNLSDTSTSANTNAQFQPDLSNPLHAFSAQEAPAKTGAEPVVRLNVSGLGGAKKRKATLAGSGNGQQDLVDASAIPRPSTADPHAKARTGMKPRFSEGSSGTNPSGFSRREASRSLIAPVPHPAAAPLLTKATIDSFDTPSESFRQFKTPAMPNGFKPQDGSRGDVQMDTNVTGNGGADDQDSRSFESSHHLHTPDVSVETLVGHEDQDFFDPKDSYRGGSGQAYPPSAAMVQGARRILVDENGMQITVTGGQYGERQGRILQQADTIGASRQHVGVKRTHGEANANQLGNGLDAYGAPGAARLKMAKSNATRRMSTDQQYSAAPPQHQQAPSEQHFATSISQDGYEYAPGSQECLEDLPDITSPPTLGSTLDEILNADVAQFLSAHMEEYNEVLRRWENCTMEEWLRGPEEMAAEFSELLNLVKDEMTDQMKFYATLETKLDEHNETLDVRQESFELAKNRALEEGGRVLK